jgi:hypothetical protein
MTPIVFRSREWLSVASTLYRLHLSVVSVAQGPSDDAGFIQTQEQTGRDYSEGQRGKREVPSTAMHHLSLGRGNRIIVPVA